MEPKDLEKTAKFVEAWPVIQEAVDRLTRQVEGIDNQRFKSEDYMRYYTTIFNLSHPNPTGEYSHLLYDKYKEIFEDYIANKVLPSLEGKQDEALLQELQRRWTNYKTFNAWLSRFFHYIDRYFVARHKLPSLQEASILSFNQLVFGDITVQVEDAIISMIDRERGGEQIDQDLVKNIIAIYVEIGVGSMKYYEKDFEDAHV